MRTAVATGKMENQDLHDEVTKWWKTEAFGTKYTEAPRRSKQDEAALDIFSRTTKRAGERYETGLLWKSPDVKTSCKRLQRHVQTAFYRKKTGS